MLQEISVLQVFLLILEVFKKGPEKFISVIFFGFKYLKWDSTETQVPKSKSLELRTLEYIFKNRVLLPGKSSPVPDQDLSIICSRDPESKCTNNEVECLSK